MRCQLQRHSVCRGPKAILSHTLPQDSVLCLDEDPDQPPVPCICTCPGRQKSSNTSPRLCSWLCAVRRGAGPAAGALLLRRPQLPQAHELSEDLAACRCAAGRGSAAARATQLRCAAAAPDVLAPAGVGRSGCPSGLTARQHMPQLTAAAGGAASPPAACGGKLERVAKAGV